MKYTIIVILLTLLVLVVYDSPKLKPSVLETNKIKELEQQNYYLGGISLAHIKLGIDEPAPANNYDCKYDLTHRIKEINDDLR